MFKFTVSGKGDVHPVEYLSAYLACNWVRPTLFEYCMYQYEVMESKFRKWLCVLYMVRKCFCDGNDGDNDNGDSDD